MPKLRILSGSQIVGILEGFGFQQVSQNGRHVKLHRVIDGRRETLTVALHSEMDKGTVRAIYRQALHYITADQLESYFFAD